jgi:tRNA(Ile)-lysidine synthase
VKLHITHFDTNEFAKEQHLSIEMAARKLRYDWFEELRRKNDASAIAVAHHRDDSVETFMLNLIRGTGINGLKGIAARNGHIIRPLLKESRESVIDYLNGIGQDFITDSTNLQDEYMRNKIRLNILPLMKEINPSVMRSIDSVSERLSEVADIYNQDRKEALSKKMIQISDSEFVIRIEDILSDIAPLSLLHEALAPLGFNSSQTSSIFSHINKPLPQSGKSFLADEWEVLCDRSELIVHRRNSAFMLPELQIEERELCEMTEIPKDRHMACLDADKVILPLNVRRWETGDKFVPLGMKGKKKISDYLTDKKYTLYQKEQQCVVCCGKDIVWVVNERIDHRFRITEDTRRVLIISVRKEKRMR